MGNTSGRHRLNSVRQTLARRHVSSIQTDISRFLLTDIGRKKQVRTSSDRHWSNPSDRRRQERHWVDPGRHQVIPSDRLATDVGKHFGQTSIELIRQTLARRHVSSVRTDISRFLLTDIGRKKQVRISSDRHWSNPSDRCRQERHWVDPVRHQVIPSDRLAKDVGKHF